MQSPETSRTAARPIERKAEINIHCFHMQANLHVEAKT